MESSTSCGLRLSVQMLMDCDVTTVLTKCFFLPTAVSMKRPKMNPDVKSSQFNL